MNIDFDYIKRVAGKLNEAFTEAGDMYTQLNEGSAVYSVYFEPQTGSCDIHVQWPCFRNLVANSADHPATYSRMQQSSEDEPWIHWMCDVQGVHISACMEKSDIVEELKGLVAKHPESDYEVCEDDDIEHMLSIWQNMTGWNL